MLGNQTLDGRVCLFGYSVGGELYTLLKSPISVHEKNYGVYTNKTGYKQRTYEVRSSLSSSQELHKALGSIQVPATCSGLENCPSSWSREAKDEGPTDLTRNTL